MLVKTLIKYIINIKKFYFNEKLRKNTSIIEFDKLEEIDFNNDVNNIFNINVFEISENRGYVRRTNHSFYSNKIELKNRNQNRKLINGIFSYEIKDNNILYKPVLNCSEVPNFEDPRFKSVNGTEYLLLNKVIEDKDKWYFHQVLFNVKDNYELELDRTRGNNKNYVFKNSNKVQIITDTNPRRELVVEENDIKTIEYRKIYSSEQLYNNGSNEVSIGDYEVRVIRSRFKSLSSPGFHITYFELRKDKEIYLSDGYFLSDKKLEVCNSLRVENDEIVMVWTVEDLKIMRGKISQDRFTREIIKNAIKVGELLEL